MYNNFTLRGTERCKKERKDKRICFKDTKNVMIYKLEIYVMS